MNKELSVLLMGYSGQRNFGDDLLLKLAYNYLDENSIKMTIHTSNIGHGSDYLYEWFPNAKIVKSKSISIKLVTSHSHVLYFGGGVFFEYEDVSFIQYLKRIYSILKIFIIPKFLRKVKYAGIGIGLGPFLSNRGENLYKIRLKQFDYLNIRDDYSKNKCEEWGLYGTTITPDLSFAFYHHLQPHIQGNQSNKVLICPRDYPHGSNKNKYINNLLNVCQNFTERGYKLTIFGFQDEHDSKVLALFEQLKATILAWNPEKMKIEDVFKIFSEHEYIITARMHGVFVAGMVNRPSIGIKVDPKLEYAAQFFQNSCIVENNSDLDEFNSCLFKIKGEKNNMNDILMIADECCNRYHDVINWIKCQ